MRVTVFFIARPCSLADRYQRFRGACYLHLQDGRGEGKRLIYLGNGGKTFLWKVDTYLLNYTASHSRML
jgi:hypothetical protein